MKKDKPEWMKFDVVDWGKCSKCKKLVPSNWVRYRLCVPCDLFDKKIQPAMKAIANRHNRVADFLDHHPERVLDTERGPRFNYWKVWNDAYNTDIPLGARSVVLSNAETNWLANFIAVRYNKKGKLLPYIVKLLSESGLLNVRRIRTLVANEEEQDITSIVEDVVESPKV